MQWSLRSFYRLCLCNVQIRIVNECIFSHQYRSHVYINREVADCIKRVLPVIAPDMSVSGYISNILVEHLQQHWDEINELYNKEYYKPLKPF